MFFSQLLTVAVAVVKVGDYGIEKCNSTYFAIAARRAREKPTHVLVVLRYDEKRMALLLAGLP